MTDNRYIQTATSIKNIREVRAANPTRYDVKHCVEVKIFSFRDVSRPSAIFALHFTEDDHGRALAKQLRDAINMRHKND